MSSESNFSFGSATPDSSGHTIHPDAFSRCNVCNVYFHAFSSLWQHIVDYHSTTQLKFYCENCNYALSNSSDFQIHIISILHNIKPADIDFQLYVHYFSGFGVQVLAYWDLYKGPYPHTSNNF